MHYVYTYNRMNNENQRPNKYKLKTVSLFILKINKDMNYIETLL